MKSAFIVLVLVVLTSAAAAVWLRKLVHAALCLTVTFASLAALYLQLGAEFVGFAQILVYVGAVAILVIFTILLTRNAGMTPELRWSKHSGIIGTAIALLVLGCLLISLSASSGMGRLAAYTPAPAVNTQRIGEQLMTRYVLPLEVLGLLLTAAMIGAVILAMPEKADVNTDAGREEHQ
jgi:NADH:ubiquinone oxidoreductase subunit 6 (subunit J)